MKHKNTTIIAAIILATLTILAASGQGAALWREFCPDPGVIAVRSGSGPGGESGNWAECVGATTPSPTAEPPTATATAVPSPTATTAPTATPGGSLPLCTDHDSTIYHALISEDGSCHYDHEHKHDPDTPEMVAIFGPAGEWLGGSSISYPWETDEENHHKHEAYGWVTRVDIPSHGRAVWISAFRVQGHVDATPFRLPDGTWSGGYLGRFHSYSVEAQVCNAGGECGVVRFAGWLNYGNLEIDGVTDCAPLPDLHPLCPNGPGGRRIHFDSPQFPGNIPGKATFFWYGEPSTYEGSVEALSPVIVAFAMSDTWNEVSLATLFDPLAATFCPAGDCHLNGSTIQQHVLKFNIRAAFDQDGDGLADFNGYTDRYGRLVEGCTAVGLDCVPLILEGIPVGTVEHRDDRDLGLGPDGAMDFDTSPAALGTGSEWWITWPN